MCREKKMSLLIPLIKLLQIDKHFVKMMLPRKLDKNNVKDVHLLWSGQAYKEVVNDKYVINFHGAQTNVHLSIDQFMQLTHEVKVCHGDYLVNHLPHCVCDNCSQFRHERGIQMWNDCYLNPYFGPISSSPSEMQLIVGPVGFWGRILEGPANDVFMSDLMTGKHLYCLGLSKIYFLSVLVTSLTPKKKDL
jgi:hypothetical protein